VSDRIWMQEISFTDAEYVWKIPFDKLSKQIRVHRAACDLKSGAMPTAGRGHVSIAADRAVVPTPSSALFPATGRRSGPGSTRLTEIRSRSCAGAGFREYHRAQMAYWGAKRC